jgi:hypothetical protein
MMAAAQKAESWRAPDALVILNVRQDLHQHIHQILKPVQDGEFERFTIWQNS